MDELRPGDVRRGLGWALVASLCVAALTASVALASGSFDDTDWRVLATSLAFAVFSTTAASGGALYATGRQAGMTLAAATVVFSVLAFVLLMPNVWSDADHEDLWRAWGVCGVLALTAAHASVVIKGRRPTDGDAVVLLASASIALSVLDSSAAILAILEVFELDDVDALAQVLAILVVALVLTTVLPPILRRLQAPASSAADERAAAPEPGADPAAELLASVDRIEGATGLPAVRAECERLRALARRL